MKIVLAVFFGVLFFSLLASSYAFIESEKITPKPIIVQIPEIVQIPPEITQDHKLSRYLVFGRGSADDIRDIAPNQIASSNSANGFFSIVILPEQSASALHTRGYSVMRDVPLDFHANATFSQMSQIRKATGSESVFVKYNYTGAGIKIAIVDTGVDFSNPDMRHSLARDHNNRPIMLDPDGQGLVLTNATFAANINKFGIIENTTKQSLEKTNESLSKNATSTVYLTKNGVFLNLKQKKGTPISMYNSFFPTSGPFPIFNGTITDDYKIGKTNRDYIKSASGVYHFGMMYQGAVQGPFASVQVVPVLVVDSQIPGLYDTIIPDMSTSWKDYTRFDLKKGQKPNYDFDFTDETPIKIGNGNEFLVYDSDKNGRPDYSAGTVGAQVLDIYGIVSQNKSSIDKALKATNGTLLSGMDPHGNYFGVMTDFVGHGTSSAASISSRGVVQYDIYNNTKKYTLPGVAPNAKIIPVKALWFGDTIYGWLWSAGFDNTNSTWHFSGTPRADIISNSWGISTFPTFKSAPGVDHLSLVASLISVPQSLDERYPGVVMISSAGNAGHGYGTIGMPNAAPFGIAVGATTNNVYVGYGSFKGQPRFGNTTIHANDMIDFSSRGPSVIGDPKPDVVDTGAYGFTPANTLKAKPSSKQEPFSLFGGTSMAAPLAAGSAAILMESLRDKNEDYDPFKIKNILMSTATDLQNDPYTQGSGLVNSYKAVSFVKGEGGVFIAYNNSTYHNVKKILDEPLSQLDSSVLGIDSLALHEKPQHQTSWFGGRLVQGEKSTTTFTIENPTNQTITIHITPKHLKLIHEFKLNSTTKLKLADTLYTKPGVYRPDYIKLEDIKPHDSLSSYYENATIPSDSSLMVLNLNYAFGNFLNKTEKMYAADTKVASIYLYDWADKNKDDKVSSDELSLVNRGGSWGTVPELRVSEPQSKFKDTPLVGVYPVPTRYSYWLGDTKKNSTSMDYTVSASHFKKEDWGDIWLESNLVHVKPKSASQVSATITTNDAKPGLYQGFIEFRGENHTVNAPVSFAVTTPIQKKEKLTVIPGSQSSILYGNGYVKGAFDMVNRYNAGDWRPYYFDITDSTINAASIDISWKDPDTNLSVFVIDPKGRIIQTNAPPGVFGQFLDWPTSDWLGTSVFSEGGGFFPVKNKDQTSTVLYAPINQTGTYTLLVHSTLFGGASTTEPYTVLAQFSTLLADNTPPQITFDIQEFVNKIPTPQITDDGEFSARYYLDDSEITLEDFDAIPEGYHKFTIEASDESGNSSSKTVFFTVDKTIPDITIHSPQNNTKVSGVIILDFAADGETLVVLPSGESVQNKTRMEIDTSGLEGHNRIVVSATDRTGNFAQKTIAFEVSEQVPMTEPTKPATEPATPKAGLDANTILLIIAGAFAIGVACFIVLTHKR